jgi:cysteinyl-tRNA synthetase
MNLTREHLQEKQVQLDGFVKTVDGLINSEPPKASARANGSAQAERLIDQIIQGFEREMNDDLNVRRAFDNVSAIVSKLRRIQQAEGLTKAQVKRLQENLHRIDNVLQVIFNE